MTAVDTTTRDAALLPPSLRTTLAALYREFAQAAAEIKRDEIVNHCLREASALEYGGFVDLERTDAGS